MEIFLARVRVSSHFARGTSAARENCVLESSAALFTDLVHPTPEPAHTCGKTIDSIDVIVHSWPCTIGIRPLLTALNLRTSNFPPTVASREIIMNVSLEIRAYM